MTTAESTAPVAARTAVPGVRVVGVVVVAVMVTPPKDGVRPSPPAPTTLGTPGRARPQPEGSPASPSGRNRTGAGSPRRRRRPVHRRPTVWRHEAPRGRAPARRRRRRPRRGPAGREPARPVHPGAHGRLPALGVGAPALRHRVVHPGGLPAPRPAAGPGHLRRDPVDLDLPAL